MDGIDKLEKLYESYVCVCDDNPSGEICTACQIGSELTSISEIAFNCYDKFKALEV